MSLAKINTIKSKNDFDFMFKNGRFYYFPFVTVVIYKDRSHFIDGDVGFIASKKNGNAVWRNKNKRKLREIYKTLKVKSNLKILLIANRNTINYSNNIIVNKINEKILKSE